MEVGGNVLSDTNEQIRNAEKKNERFFRMGIGFIFFFFLTTRIIFWNCLIIIKEKMVKT